MYTRTQVNQLESTYLIIVDIQNSFLEDLSTRLVIPLGLKSSFSNESMDRLTPEITYQNDKLLLLTPQLASVPSSLLLNPVGSLSHLRENIINALDFAISGM